MPTLSASDFTNYLKFKAAAQSPIQRSIQTRDNVSLSQSVLNANILATQAAVLTTPNKTIVSTLPVTVSTARTDILSAAARVSGVITYTSSQAHGLTTGDVISVTGFGGLTDANVVNKAVSVTGSTTFTIAVAGVDATATATGSITGRVYYTTSAAHGLLVGQKNISVTGLSTSAFNLSLATMLSAPSTTTFVVSSTATGTAATTQTAPITVTAFYNTSVLTSSLARVIAQPPNNVNNPNALSTISYAGTSGALSSSAYTRAGGLPTGFKNSQGTYTRVPQNAGWIQGGKGNLSSGQKRF